LLLIDEDTSATNFMIRDERMQQLVAKEKEPITPLLFRVRELYQQHQVSSVIVMGGSGDYFDIADTVIMMDNYLPHDVTEQAKRLAREISAQTQALPEFELVSRRKPGMRVLDASRGKREVKIDAQGVKTIRYGQYDIDISYLEQLVDVAQTRSIGLAIHYYARHYAKQGNLSLQQGLQALMQDIQQKGIDILSQYKVGNLAEPRLFEIAAAINRIRCQDWSNRS
jgi:predicted ABC-class ATPase